MTVVNPTSGKFGFSCRVPESGMPPWQTLKEEQQCPGENPSPDVSLYASQVEYLH